LWEILNSCVVFSAFKIFSKPAMLTCFTIPIKFYININKLTDHSNGALPMNLHCTDSLHNTYLTFTGLCSLC
jgi:hypothetical protein